MLSNHRSYDSLSSSSSYPRPLPSLPQRPSSSGKAFPQHQPRPLPALPSRSTSSTPEPKRTSNNDRRSIGPHHNERSRNKSQRSPLILGPRKRSEASMVPLLPYPGLPKAVDHVESPGSLQPVPIRQSVAPRSLEVQDEPRPKLHLNIPPSPSANRARRPPLQRQSSIDSLAVQPPRLASKITLAPLVTENQHQPNLATSRLKLLSLAVWEANMNASRIRSNSPQITSSPSIYSEGSSERGLQSSRSEGDLKSSMLSPMIFTSPESLE